MSDIVSEYIELKKQGKEVEEKLRALETLIFSEEEHRKDSRIKIIAGRKTVELTDNAYNTLEEIGVDIFIVEKRKKRLDEFDATVREALLVNPDNYTEKTTKESIRINKE